ncbi:hypothetical protein [uncultured Arthrobacter sp.]|uniref:hypothetical protein n=1 Tax=uncultured Arthrobacter sp. TaxID=114050 RepID=UPI003216DEF9
MPTVIKSSSNVSELGELSTYNISTSAIPYDTSDSSGAIPTVSVTMADGKETDYLIGETLTLENQAVGKYVGEIVEVSGSANSGRYTMSAETLLSRLNSEQRLYPSPSKTTPTVWMPLGTLDYWSQECGVFYDAVPGDVLFYQSNYYHWFAFAKGATKPIRGINYIPSGAPGEELSSGYSLGARLVSNFGKNRELTVDFPSAEPLPILIPSPSDSRVMVFSSGILNQGTGRKATITWNFTTPDKKPLAIRVTIDNAAGMSYQVNDAGVFNEVASIPGAINGNYRVQLALTSTTATSTQFTFRTVSDTGAILDAAPNVPVTTLRGNLSLTKIVYRGEDQGSGSQILHWGDFISVMDAMPTTRLVTQKNLTPGPKQAQTFVGFSGNVWESIKAYCSIYHLDVSYTGGLLTIGPRQTETTPLAALGTLSKRISKRDQARFVELVCQNSKPTLSADGTTVSPQVMWKADSVYQVAVGEIQEFLVQTEHSILELQQPVAVSGISPFPYKSGTGQYVVTGSDGYIVSPTFWRDQGGKITVETTENEGEIKVVIKGPDFDSARAPYRISEGDAGRPALYITGQGVINTPTTLKVSTGNTRAAKEVGVKLESPFISDLTLAYDAAARAARKFATPDVAVSISEALGYDATSDLGQRPAGQLIKRDGNILRITDTSQTPAALSGTAVQYNTIDQVKRSFGPSRNLARTNLASGPRPNTTTGFAYQDGTGEVSATSVDTSVGPNNLLGFLRRTITTAKTGGNSGFYRDDNNATGVTGEKVTGSLWIRSSVDIQVDLSVTCRVGTGTTAAGTAATGAKAIPANQWTRLSATTTATADYGNVQVWAILSAANILPAGATFDATQMMIEKSATLGDFFDGDSPDTLDTKYDWAGTPNASSSTATAVSGTIGQTKAYYAGKTIGQVNLKPLKVVK